FGSAAELGEDAMNVEILRAQLLEHRFISHAEIALSMRGRNVAFIAKEKMNVWPRYVRTDGLVRGQQMVKHPGGRTARKGDGEHAMVLDRVVGQQRKPSRRRQRERLEVGEHLHLLSLQGHRVPWAPSCFRLTRSSANRSR